MSLLTPDFGLLFWMVIIFVAVFVVLARYGFPVILSMVNERNNYIHNSMIAAQEANSRLTNIHKEADEIIADAHRQQGKIVLDATASAQQIINTAKQKAIIEGQKELELARKQIEAERDNALKEVRSAVVALSVEIAEKVLHSSLSNKHEHNQLINKVLDEMDSPNS